MFRLKDRNEQTALTEQSCLTNQLGAFLAVQYCLNRQLDSSRATARMQRSTRFLCTLNKIMSLFFWQKKLVISKVKILQLLLCKN
jgi:hypothetical protein